MTNDWLLRIVLFSIIHWALAGIMMTDLMGRARVVGGHKGLWLGIVMMVPGFGPLLYLLLHPDILHPEAGPGDPPAGRGRR